MRKKLIIAGVLVVIIATGFGIYKYMGSRKDKPTIRRDKTVKGDITRTVEQTGIVKAQVGAQVKVGTRATGTLMQLRFQVGDRVRKGELIAIIDDRQIRADIDSSKAGVSVAEQNYNLTKDTYPLKIAEQEAQIRTLKSQLDYAVVTLKREETLFKKGFATQDELDKATKDVDVLAAGHQQASTVLNRLKDEYGRQLEINRATVDQSKARLNSSQINLTYTKVYSPMSGIVSQVSTQEGEMVVSGLSTTNLITILDPTRMEIWIYVDETDIGKVRKGMSVEFWVDAYKEKRFSGAISAIYPQPEVKDNVVYYLAIVKVEPKDAEMLRPEMTAHVRVISETKKGVVLVPNQAVKFEKGDYIILVPKGGKNVPVNVKIGIRDDKNTEIVSGLKDGEEILIETPAMPAMQKGSQKDPGASQKK